MDVGEWLRALGLGQYATAFHDNAVDEETLRALTIDDLKELGVVLIGHRRKLLAAIAELSNQSGSAQSIAGSGREDDLPNDAAERRQVTTLFCDLVGSTALSAGLDPEDLHRLIGKYQAVATEQVTRFGGFVAKYMGDGLLAYFGYPHAHEEDAERALRAGLALVECVGQLDHAGSHLAVRVGIATGVVVVGDLIGSGSAQERGVTGETPNLAARLQAIAEPGMVIVSDMTRRLVGELFECRDLGEIELKGLPAPVRAWQVLASSAVESRFDAFHANRLTPLIGRDEEFELLKKRWARSCAGEGQVALISGEPGIGKSRLIAALRDSILDAEQSTIRYFCSPHHRDSMLFPFIGQLERAAGFDRDDSSREKRDKLRTLIAPLFESPDETLHLLAELLGIADEEVPALAMDPRRKRERTIETWLQLFRATARQSPLLVLFEDAHWADATSIELLSRAISEIPKQRILLVVTYRPEFQPPWTGHAPVCALSLTRLARSDANQLIAAVTNKRALPGDIVRHILERTDGIPLFIEELTSMLIESGLMREQGGEFVLERPLPVMAIPVSLQASLMARLDRLAPVKELAQIGAAIGREFSFELLTAVARRPEAQVMAALEQLTAAGLIFRQGTSPDPTFIFKHALVQDAAYSTLLHARRHELHARIAKVLEERFPDIAAAQPEMLAYHLTQAGLHDAAVGYWQKAGERALDRSAHPEASGHLGEAIRLIGLLPESTERNRREYRLQMALGSAMRALKGHASDETHNVYMRARSLMDDTVPAKERMAVLYGAWTATIVRGDRALAYELARDSLDVALSDDDPEATAFASRMNGIALWLMGSFEQAVPHLERVVALYAPGSGNVTDLRYSQDHAVWSQTVLALALWSLGYPDQAVAGAMRSLDWARMIDHGMTTGFALSFGSVLWGFSAEDPKAVGLDAKDALDFYVEHDLRSYISWGQFYHGLAMVRDGEHEAGVELMRAAIAGMDKINFRILWTAHLGHFGWALGMIGQVDEGLEQLSKALGAVDQLNERLYEAELHRLRGHLLERRGLHEDAEAAYLQAIEVARRQQAKSWELRALTSLAQLLLEQGRAREAVELLEPVYSWFVEGQTTADLRRARGLLQTMSEPELG